MTEKPLREDNGKYVRKDVFNAETTGIKALCDAKHQLVDSRILSLEKNAVDTNKKITATLVFVIVTLASILVAIASHALT